MQKFTVTNFQTNEILFTGTEKQVIEFVLTNYNNAWLETNQTDLNGNTVDYSKRWALFTDLVSMSSLSVKKEN